MNIGIVCHSSFGGSVVVATELAMSLGARGHQVHLFAADRPARLDEASVVFQRVATPTHPLLPSGDYLLALASKLVEVAPRLDVLHVHYAIPHAVSAALARQILGPRAPKLITTLHGTDALTLGLDPAFLAPTRFAVKSSDAVTAPSVYLKLAAEKNFDWGDGQEPIHVISNSVDAQHFRPAPVKNWEHLATLFPKASFREMPKVLTHSSNFRSLKRAQDVVRVFDRVRRETPSVLLMLGDGPERAACERLAAQFGVSESVRFLGEVVDVAPVLASSDAFILPSETESFGLAALEALSCGIPVVATNIGGLPELIQDGVTGFLHRVGGVEAMAASVARLFRDELLRLRMSAAARSSVERQWQREPMVERYEALYLSVSSVTQQ